MSGGKVEVVTSGAATTNSDVFHKISVLGYGETQVYCQYLGGGSGVTVTILGYPSFETTPLGSSYVILVSGDSINSGQVNVYSVTDAYEDLGIGYKSTQTNFSGRVTIVATRKRRQ